MILVLFDLDGTLVHTGGAGSRSMDRVFQELFGIQEASRHVRPDGKTDLQILRELYLRLVGDEQVEQVLPRLGERYLKYLPEEVQRSVAQGTYRVLPGVRDTLNWLQRQPGVVLGLATGNLEQGARIKLEPADLWTPFQGGGFGSDSEDRVQLLWAAVRKLSPEQDPDEVWIVGDTPRDIWAARRAGYRVAAVASGRYTLEDLERFEPDLLLASLEIFPEVFAQRKTAA